MNNVRHETLELLELLADSLDHLEKAQPIPEDIYNMTANTVRSLREYLNQ
jgi:type III secretion system FlhB-like substrate exporter